MSCTVGQGLAKREVLGGSEVVALKKNLDCLDYCKFIVVFQLEIL